MDFYRDSPFYGFDNTWIWIYKRGVDIYTAFVEGAKEGFKTAISIMPYLIAIFIAIGILRGSSTLDMLTDLLSP